MPGEKPLHEGRKLGKDSKVLNQEWFIILLFDFFLLPSPNSAVGSPKFLLLSLKLTERFPKKISAQFAL